MTGDFFRTTQMRVLVVFTMIMVLIALASYAILNFARVDFLNPTPATISVAGEGEILVVPDIGQFSFSVTAEGDDAATAQELSGTKVNDVLAYLREQGIEDKDIKTQNYNLYPRWRYEERICAINAYCPPGERVQDGFEVSQSIEVKIRDIETAGAIIAGVGQHGATNISGLRFTVDDMEGVREEARAEAIKDAQQKATVLAEQLGVQVVRLVSYYEEGGYAQSYYKAMPMAADEAMGLGGGEIPVGEDSETVRVNVTYEVR